MIELPIALRPHLRRSSIGTGSARQPSRGFSELMGIKPRDESEAYSQTDEILKNEVRFLLSVKNVKKLSRVAVKGLFTPSIKIVLELS
jgi:hypothetical protein